MIEIRNFTRFAVDKKFFWRVVKKVLKGENKETENLSISFVDVKIIKKLNKRYRKKDKPTDILSFERLKNIKEDFSEIVICPEVVRRDKSVKIPLKKELAKILIHGILHVLEYDHEKSKREAVIMRRREEYYSKILNLKS